MSDTKTVLEQIKDEYAREKGYPSWDEMENFIIDTALPVNIAVLLSAAWREACHRYATACCKATQERCAENSRISYSSCGDSMTCGCMGNCEHPNASINRRSITDPDNIVLL